MIKGFRLENFRSFVDSGEIELKPLTILVGRNSSGKSSVLRVLPLLKQSVMVETKEPILWFGGVDFGSLSQVRSRFSVDKNISLEMSFEGIAEEQNSFVFDDLGDRFFIRQSGFGGSLLLNTADSVSIRQRLEDSSLDEGVRISQLACTLGEDSLTISFDATGVVSDVFFNQLKLENTGSVSISLDKKGFFPRFVDIARQSSSPNQAARAMRDGPFFAALYKEVEKFFHHKTKEDGRRSITRRIRFGDSLSFRKHLDFIFASTTNRISSICDSNPSALERIRGLVLLRIFPEIVRRASTQLARFCNGIRYIEPVRARASRYYRYQELAVDEIASDGANVPMFLHSLNTRERGELESWLSQSLGFAVRAERSGDGHIQLLIKDNDVGALVNLADTGFGYSQILPIALQLWKVRKSEQSSQGPSRRDHSNLVAIEQPELHLHPQMQAILGDVFTLSLAEAKRSGATLRLLLETHSEHLINRLGELVESGRLDERDIVVYVFDRESMDTPTRVRRVGFSKEGFLMEPWPLGFFLPEI